MCSAKHSSGGSRLVDLFDLNGIPALAHQLQLSKTGVKLMHEASACGRVGARVVRASGVRSARRLARRRFSFRILRRPCRRRIFLPRRGLLRLSLRPAQLLPRTLRLQFAARAISTSRFRQHSIRQLHPQRSASAQRGLQSFSRLRSSSPGDSFPLPVARSRRAPARPPVPLRLRPHALSGSRCAACWPGVAWVPPVGPEPHAVPLSSRWRPPKPRMG